MCTNVTQVDYTKEDIVNHKITGIVARLIPKLPRITLHVGLWDWKHVRVSRHLESNQMILIVEKLGDGINCVFILSIQVEKSSGLLALAVSRVSSSRTSSVPNSSSKHLLAGETRGVGRSRGF